MSPRLAGRLNAARHSHFVGRSPEQALFESALAEAELPFHLIYVYGPGGVGKTALLREFAHLCEQAQTPVFYIDAHNIHPAPESFSNALRLAMGLTPQDSVFEAIAAHPDHTVILIDTYEMLAPLDEWMREAFLTQLPENTLVVLAGQYPPSPAWRADPGWQTLIRTIPLRNLSPQESRTYLAQLGVPGEQHQAVLDFTHGHPLALSLVVDVFAQRHDVQFRPEDTPDVVSTLLEQFAQKAPGPAHRAALEVCALVRQTTEALLAKMLDMPDAHALFEWLRGLSFVESGPGGLFPHDLTREVLVADLRWRNPDWYTELHRRARAYYASRLQQASGAEQPGVLFDYIFLHRNNFVVRPFFEWQGSSGGSADTLRAGDETALAAMVTQHEGPESAELAVHWMARQPQGVTVLRQDGLQPVGLLMAVALHHASADDLALDPAARVAWEYLQCHAPVRPGESATFFRFWMARDTYQAVSSLQSALFVNAVRHYLTMPGLAYTFFPCADPDFWAPMFAYADLARIPEVDFEVGGRRYGVYGHDWRAVSPTAWLALLAERETATRSQITPPRPTSEPLIILSEPEFAAAVQEALHASSHPNDLRHNPLLRSRLVVDLVGNQAPPAKRCTALRTLMQEAVESLQKTPRDAKLYRALYHTYLQPAPTQEQAAELLDLPFSTFRRHLKAGIIRVADSLWQKELGGPDK